MIEFMKREGVCILKKYTVAVCDFEEEYAVRLMNYINGQTTYGILALAFTDENRFREYLENNSLDLALIAEEFEVEQMEDRVIPLCREEGREGIYKYQPASKIIAKVQMILEKEYRVKDSKVKGEIAPCKMIGVYSPIGRSGKTNLALAMAKEKG